MWYQKLVSPWNRDILSKYPSLFIWLELKILDVNRLLGFFCKLFEICELSDFCDSRDGVL